MSNQRRSRLHCCVVLLFCFLSLAAIAAQGQGVVTAASITVVEGTLPEAKLLASRRARPQEWLEVQTSDFATDFVGEDKRARDQWQEWKKNVRSLRAYQQQQQLEKEKQKERVDGEGGDGADGDDAAPNRGRGKDGAATQLTEFFSEQQSLRRTQNRLKKLARFNRTTVDGRKAAEAELRSDVAALWDRLRSAGTSASVTDQSFLGLAERHFAHTFADYTTNASSANHPAAELSSLTLLRTPVLLEAAVVPYAEREVRQLRQLWSQHSAGESDAAAATADVDTQLLALESLLNTTRTTLTRVVHLAAPLADAAARWVESTLAETRSGILANDEATEAKREELRQLLKQRSRLEKTRRALETHTATYKSVLRHQQLPTAEALLFGLELVAQQRLGDAVTGLLESLPQLSLSAPLTGVTEEEWTTHVLFPFAWCLAITAALLWVAEEAKEWCLRRVQAARLRTTAGGPSARSGAKGGSGHLRKLFMFASLTEVLVPPLLPVVVVAVHLRGADEWAASALYVMRASQRVLFVGCMVLLIGGNYVWGRVVRRLFRLIDPSTYRRRHTKVQ